MKNTFQKHERLTLDSDFRRVYREGRCFTNNFLKLYVLKKKEGQTRVGFSVRNDLGNAVKRNRIKRLLVEAYRLNKWMIKPNLDLVMVPSKMMIGMNFYEVEKVMCDLLRRVCVLEDDKH